MAARAGAANGGDITYMAMEVERRVLGGAQDFEITLYPPAFRPDPAEEARRLRAALIAAGGRLVSIAPGINGSGQYRARRLPHR
jgi:hypothetical protein